LTSPALADELSPDDPGEPDEQEDTARTRQVATTVAESTWVRALRDGVRERSRIIVAPV
jgi:hypothetical protein